MPAIEARERLVEFVERGGGGLRYVRQRENALVYVRGLVEHGGRKSLQPTLFRLGGDAARYESLQQFLADSPWDPALLVRACAERVAPELGVVAWVVDDTGIPKDGRHSPGVKRQYSGTLGKIGNCQMTVSRARGRRARHAAAGLGAVSARGVVRDLARRRKAKIPDAVVFQTKPELAGGLCEQAAGWEIPRAPVLGDCGLRRRHAASAAACTSWGSSTCWRSGGDGVFGPETTFAVPERSGRAGRPPTRRAPRPQARVGRERSPSGCPPRRGRRCPAARRRPGENVHGRFAFVRVVAAHTRSAATIRPPRGEWLIIEWPEGARPRPTTGSPTCPSDEPARAARPARAAALDDRARLPPAQRRARARPLRRPQLPRLPPPLRARHLRARLPHARTPATQKPGGRPDAPAGGAAPAARPALLGRPLPNLPPARRSPPTRPLPPTRVTKSY